MHVPLAILILSRRQNSQAHQRVHVYNSRRHFHPTRKRLLSFSQASPLSRSFSLSLSHLLIKSCHTPPSSWEGGRMEGKGVHVCAEGSRYEGDFRANYRHGQGRCQWGNRHDTPFRCTPAIWSWCLSPCAVRCNTSLLASVTFDTYFGVLCVRM